jgi:hypothetical protein
VAVGVAIIKEALAGGLYKIAHNIGGVQRETLSRSDATLTQGQRVLCGQDRDGAEVVLFPSVAQSFFVRGVVTAATATNETVGGVGVVFPCSGLTYSVRVGDDPDDEDATEYENLTPRVRQFRDVGMAPAAVGSVAVLVFIPGDLPGGGFTVQLESVDGEWVPTDPDCPQATP